MSVTQYQRQVNNLDKEISDLEKKKAVKDTDCANLQKKINTTKKSIGKNTSQSMLNSKLKQISGWEADCAKKSGESADLGKKISEKRSKRNDAYLKLQKAQLDEQKKQEKEIKKMQQSYENRIVQITSQITPHIPIQNEYKNSNITDEQYDVFISHAWEDKADFVDEFVQELENLGIKAWYDKKQITWGDSMRARIDEGLKNSQFGVAVLSPNYIAEGKYWTKSELDGLFQLESVNGKMLLPIWHQLMKKEVLAYSPIIANKLAMSTAILTPKEIAEELQKLLSSTKAEDEKNE